MDYTKFFTRISKRRKPNLIRQLTEAYMKNRDALFFAGGMPNARLFPFKEISVTYSDGTHKRLVEDDLFTALQYGPSQGYPPLVKKWREFQEKWHSPKIKDWDVFFTTGSMEGCSKVFELLLEENDPVMVQSPTYSGILGGLLPLNPDFIPINMDNDGALPQDIVRTCEERIKDKKPLPKVLYVNPTGANPIGTVYSNERKKEIYRLAQRYNFIILEDDAYYFIHFLGEQPRSFLSLDVDGRVIRFDSFSKIMSAGLRLGVVTAPKPLLSKLELHVSCSTLHTSSLSQVIIHKLLETWNDEDINAHFAKLQQFYRDSRDTMLKTLEKYFTGIGEWSAPQGGMFVWLKVTVLDDVYDIVMNKFTSNGIYVLPGHAFYPDSTKPCSYIRLSYSQMKPDEIDKGIKEMAKLIREEAGRNNKLNGFHNANS